MKKKKDMSGWAVFLLIIIYFSAAGMNLTSNNIDIRENAYAYALINVAISSIIMMAEPFIWRLVNKEKLPLEKGKRICMSNSICMFIISIVLMWFFGIAFVGGLGAIMYYFINKWLFVNLDGDTETYHYYECENCGELVSKSDKKCPKCNLAFNNKINSKIRKETKKAEDIKLNKSEINKETSHNKKDIDIEETELIEEVTIDKSIYKKAVELCLSGEKEEAESNFKEYISQVVKHNKGEKYTTCNNILEFYIYCTLYKPEDELKDLNYRVNTSYFYLASMEYDRGNNEEAITYLNKGLKYNPVDTSILFEKAENYKALHDMKKFHDNTLDIYKYIYTKNDLAKYYRNLGYYYIENKEYDLAKALYLYSLRFENSKIVNKELEYIISKSDDSLPAKNRLENILSKNNIPLFIDENVIDIIIKLDQELKASNNSNTSVGKFIKQVKEELQI